jgi:serine/threonine protein kinase
MSLPNREIWKQLSPLLDEFLALDEPSRGTRMAELRESNEALATELESLLGSACRADKTQFLAGDVGRHTAAESAAAASLAGKQIGAYVIEAPLGDGSTGSVWRARRSDGRFEGSVAVKLLHMSLIGRSGALRFQREGVILARLTHPNIARLLDAGVTSEGQPYLVLELVDGKRIDQHCNDLRLDVTERLRLFRDVLAAVAHAHSHLVIHRDIKPNNILVAHDGTVKLLDFGISKLQEECEEESPITMDGQHVLTPEYAAPEQVQGGPITTATDIYALGVLLFKLLAGRHPTAEDTCYAADVFRTTLESEPVRLAAALNGAFRCSSEDPTRIAAERRTPLARLRRQLKGDLENITARTLRKNPCERYQTVAALADDLQRHLTNQPVSALPESWRYRCSKFVRRHRNMVAAGVLLAVAVTAGLAGTITQARLAQAQAATAQHERDNALRQLAYAKSSNEFITFLLQEGNDKPFTTAELLAHAEPVLEKQFADDPAQRAHLLSQLSALYTQATYLDKAQALLLRAKADARGVPDLSLQARIDCLLAFQQGVNGSFDQARASFDETIAKLRGTHEIIDRAVLAECLQFRGEIADIKGDANSALADAQAALDSLGTPRPEERTLAIVMRNVLASAQGKLGHSSTGAAEYRRAIAELEAMGRGHTWQASGLYQNLGVLLSRAGQSVAALEAYRQALDITRGLGGANPGLEGSYANRLIEMGRSREAIPLIEHAVAEANRRGDKRTAPSLLVQGAQAWCLTNDVAHCGELIDTARAGLKDILPPGHSLFGSLELANAQWLIARGSLPDARNALTRAVAIFDAASEKNQASIRALTLLARIEQQLGDIDAARLHAELAVARARETMSGFAHSEWLGSALVAQGMVQQARGEPNMAQASWRAAANELEATLGDSAPATVEARHFIVNDNASARAALHSAVERSALHHSSISSTAEGSEPIATVCD